MKKRRTLMFVALFLLLFGTVGAALAMSSTNYDLPKNTTQAGFAGGDVSASTNYRMISSVGGAIQVSSTSASYEMCSGFLCGWSDLLMWKLFIPLVLKAAH